jgi:hypothetical protein
MTMALNGKGFGERSRRCHCFVQQEQNAKICSFEQVWLTCVGRRSRSLPVAQRDQGVAEQYFVQQECSAVG